MKPIIFCFCFFPLFCLFSGWTHLELGAGNYGKDGHSKASQRKTVLMKLRHVSDAPNYIDELDENGRDDYNPREQYYVLFWTLDELIHRFGPEGVFHVNDLYEEYASVAAEKLKEYANQQGYHSIIIETVSGDYETINTTQSLLAYGKVKYDSVHLKNPEVSFYYDQLDGDQYYSSEIYREEARNLLQNLANLSSHGLDFFILNDFMPSREQELVEDGVFYQQNAHWESLPYIFPDGEIHSMPGRTFFIPTSVEPLDELD